MIELPARVEYPNGATHRLHVTPALGLGILGLIGLGLLMVSPARRALTSPKGLDTLMYALRRSRVPIPIIAGLASLLGMNREQIRTATEPARSVARPNAF